MIFTLMMSNKANKMKKEFYEVVFTVLDDRNYTNRTITVIGRDVKHFADEREAIAFHNSLKDNDKVASAIIDKVYYDPESFLSGRTETAYYANPIHKDYLNSRSGDKRFEDPEPIVQFLQRKMKARKEFGTSLALNEMKKEVSYRVEYTTLDGEKAKSSIYNSKKEADKKEAKLVNSGIRKAKVVEIPLNEFDDKSMKAYGDAMKVALGSGEKSTSIEKIYMDMLKNELPSQDEVNDAFEKFERETHYLNNKPVGEWDAMDMSNWKSILRKNGKLFMSVKESIAKYKVSHTKKDSSKSSMDFIGGLNAEDEFYKLMDDDNIISAKIEYFGFGGDEGETTDTWSRDKDGKVSFGGKKSEFSHLFKK